MPEFAEEQLVQIPGPYSLLRATPHRASATGGTRPSPCQNDPRRLGLLERAAPRQSRPAPRCFIGGHRKPGARAAEQELRGQLPGRIRDLPGKAGKETQRDGVQPVQLIAANSTTTLGVVPMSLPLALPAVGFEARGNRPDASPLLGFGGRSGLLGWHGARSYWTVRSRAARRARWSPRLGPVWRPGRDAEQEREKPGRWQRMRTGRPPRAPWTTTGRRPRSRPTTSHGHEDGNAVLLLRTHRYTGTVSYFLCWATHPGPAGQAHLRGTVIPEPRRDKAHRDAWSL